MRGPSVVNELHVLEKVQSRLRHACRKTRAALRASVHTCSLEVDCLTAHQVRPPMHLRYFSMYPRNDASRSGLVALIPLTKYKIQMTSAALLLASRRFHGRSCAVFVSLPHKFLPVHMHI